MHFLKQWILSLLLSTNISSVEDVVQALLVSSFSNLRAKKQATRKHSSRMRTAQLPPVHASGGRVLGALSSEVPCLGASKRPVRSHVWARAGARGSLYSEVPCLSGIRAGTGGPCMVRSNASWVMVAWDRLPLSRMTDMSENITFPQLRWRAVKK